MKYQVVWYENVRHEVVLEATSHEEAAKLVEEGQFDTDEVQSSHEFQGVATVREDHTLSFEVGERVRVKQRDASGLPGLSYPSFHGTLQERVWTQRVGDSVDVVNDQGQSVMVYSISLEKEA